MKALFNYITVISAIIVITTVLLQQTGSGLGASFGGETGGYRTRRGAERTIYFTTIGAAVVMVVSVLLSILSK